ncbi:MAG: sugar ABC transporter substrate-binding protein [Spirochaetaceae bacterium]|jgi:multiple sugar transport system substrate-binding protein|nr:sugar ABC transporter substrate-binding protein [Spirochaetaceae bacterium]
MKKTTKTALTAFICLALAASFTGCKGKQSQGSQNGPVTIKVAVWDVTTIKYYSELVEAFDKAHPNISVEVFDIPAADYTQKLSVMLNGGSDVDAFWIKDGDTTKGISNRGQLADLSAYVARDSIDLADFNGLAERFNIDSKLVALPAATAYYVLFYNKDIFDKAGVPYPSNDLTWSQWEQLAGRVTSGSGTDKIYGAHFHTWQACVQNWAVQDGKHTIVDTDYSFMKPYYEMAIRMQDAGVVMDYGSLKAGNIAYTNAFLRGNIAMIPMGFWLASGIKDRIDNGELEMNWGVAAIPHPDETPAGWTVGSVTPIAINQASKYKEEAWEFVKFVTSEEGANIYTKYTTFPGRANAKNLAEIANVPGMPSGLLEALEVKNIALDRPMVDYVAEVNQMLNEEHSLIMLKEVGVDEGLANMSRRSREIQGK